MRLFISRMSFLIVAVVWPMQFIEAKHRHPAPKRHFHLNPFHATTKELASWSALAAATPHRALPPCEPTIPNLNEVTPIQNPNAPAVAFFPNSSVSNSTQLPPQTVGAQVSLSSANTVWGIETPFNIGPVVGASQAIFISSWVFQSYDRNLIPDNQFNTDLISFINADNDFSLSVFSQEIQMRYDKFEDRFFFTADLILTDGTTQNEGFVFGVSDSGVINENTSWTIVKVYNGNLTPDSNGCPGDVTTGGTFYDYCKASVDSNAYYFTFDIFSRRVLPVQSTYQFLQVHL